MLSDAGMKGVIAVAALSDIGCRRQNNEDSFGYDPALGLFAVSDGMGGGAAGEVASHHCIEQLFTNFRRMGERDGIAAKSDRLFHAAREANATVYTMSAADPALRGMGATLVAVCFEERSATVLNVGDSRAYLLRGAECLQITRDHSLSNELERHTGLSADQLAFAAQTITRSMGTAPDVEADLFGAELMTGDRLLLASDGLMRHVPDAEIASIVAASTSVGAACELLIQRTVERGAQDNVTCLLVEVG